jgi:hypothetical protein
MISETECNQWKCRCCNIQQGLKRPVIQSLAVTTKFFPATNFPFGIWELVFAVLAVSLGYLWHTGNGKPNPNKLRPT